jgi:hypothetical protein
MKFLQGDAAEGEHLDPSMEAQMQWHQIQGTRKERTDQLIHNEDNMALIRLSAVVRLSGRMLAIYFIRSAFGRLPKRGGLPYAVDLASDASSRVTVVLQHLSAQLSGHARSIVVGACGPSLPHAHGAYVACCSGPIKL